MFCHKCGNNVVEGVAFCPKCGTKFAGNDTEQQAAAAAYTVPAQSQAPVVQAMNPAKKKSKKLPIILGAVVLVVVIIAVASGLGGDSIDYVATAKAWEPFAQSQGLPGTCGTIIAQYIDAPEWSSTLVDDIAHVAVNGTLKGATDQLSITITVAPGETEDSVTFDFVQATINGNQTTNSNDVTELMIAFFAAYNDGQEYFDPNVYLS